MGLYPRDAHIPDIPVKNNIPVRIIRAHKPGVRMCTTLRNMAGSMGIYRGFSSGYPIVLSFSQEERSNSAHTFLSTITPLGPGGAPPSPTHGIFPS